MDLISLSTLFTLFYIFGLSLSVLALWRSRTPQGATAWIIGLASFPFISIPLFLIFGRNKFYTYVNRRKILDRHAESALDGLKKFDDLKIQKSPLYFELEAIIDQSQKLKFIKGNDVELLIDGEATFSRLLAAIESTKEYILFQFYIFRDDNTGNLFKKALIKKASEGVKVYFLYDGIGSNISRQSLREMKEAGLHISAFKSNRTWTNKFQINFRNHRKLVVIDGHTSFIGGHNIGDEYVGKTKRGHWRDTHVGIYGPSATISQFSFVKDWYWVNKKVPQLNWSPESKGTQDKSVCILHTGPADNLEACQLTYMSLVNLCKKRLWIGTPYFVPSESFVNSLIVAALRGCEIKIILPLNNDSFLVKAAEKVYIEKLLKFGVQFYYYPKGYLHQKVMLIDDHTSVIGSSNLDSRSFFINFEIHSIISDQDFSHRVQNMLSNDLENSLRYTSEELNKRNLAEKIISRAANLLSPIL